MSTLLPIRGEHYLHKGRIYRVEMASRGTDEVILEDIEDGSLWEVRHVVFRHAYERVWKIGDVAQFLERSPRSIYRYEAAGLIEKPNRYPAKGPHHIRFYTKQDVLNMHEMISEISQGRPRKDGRVTNNSLPSKASLSLMFRERFGE